MKKFILLITSIVSLINCKSGYDREGTVEAEKSKIIFEPSIQSKFEIISHDKERGYTFHTTESNFTRPSIQLSEQDYNEYFANIITTTRAITGLNNSKKNIKIDIRLFNRPDSLVTHIDKNCDEIVLHDHTYESIKYDCCGGFNDYHEIYDYKNNQIIKGIGLKTGNIPNSRLVLYSSFAYAKGDSSMIGHFYYSTTSSDRYIVNLKGEDVQIRGCEESSPYITFITKKNVDKYDSSSHKYTLWSFNNIEKATEINNLTINIKLSCRDKSDLISVDIPIVNGLPFGKKEKIQEITVHY